MATRTRKSESGAKLQADIYRQLRGTTGSAAATVPMPLAVPQAPSAEVTPAVLQAVIRGLSKSELAAESVQPGKHQLKGTMTVSLDCWLTKGEPTTVRQAIPTAKILAHALRNAGLDAETLTLLLFDAATEIVTNGADQAATDAWIDAALEPIKVIMPHKDRDGSTNLAGRVEIVGFSKGGAA